jgi:hypothetical protein
MWCDTLVFCVPCPIYIYFKKTINPSPKKRKKEMRVGVVKPPSRGGWPFGLGLVLPPSSFFFFYNFIILILIFNIT